MKLIRGDKKITIKEGTIVIKQEEFLNHIDLEEIVIPDSVEVIQISAFMGCTSLKKITLPKNLKLIGDFAFSNCKSLEEVNFAEGCKLNTLSSAIFSYCTNLKKIDIPESLNNICRSAFYKCKSLQEINLNENLYLIEEFAFYGTGLKKIYIPKKVENIKSGAFSNTLNLERIEVSKESETFLTQDNISLVNYNLGTFIQYAPNSKNKSYEILPYESPYESKEEIFIIDHYAFEGARHLQELTIRSSIDHWGLDCFKNCNNLKKLKVYYAWYCTINNISSYITSKNEIRNTPFTELIIGENIKELSNKTYFNFTNLEKLELPSSLKVIEESVFANSKKLKEVTIPSDFNKIEINAFHKNTIMKFSDNLSLTTDNILSIKQVDDYIISKTIKEEYHIYHKSYGKISELSYEDIANSTINSKELIQNPEKIIIYIDKLSEILQNLNMENSSVALKRLRNLFISEEKTDYEIKAEIFQIIKKGLNNEFPLLSINFILGLDKENATTLLENYDDTLEKFLTYSKLSTDSPTPIIKHLLNNSNLIVEYTQLLNKYQINDPYLYNNITIAILDKSSKEYMLENWSPYLKKIIISSNISEDDEYGLKNISGLTKLCNILGMHIENDVYRQKISNFISEKIFSSHIGKDIINKYQISNRRINEVFDDIRPREEFDMEFPIFFIENYKELYDIENIEPKTIKKIYNNFRQISNSALSNKGEQRQLKVTLKKCLEFIAINKFENVTEENKEIAELIGLWHDKNECFEWAVELNKESKKAPRNIFEKYKSDNQDINSNANDLLEESIDDYSYEWLPKQDLRNLVLGKYCNCCAHLEGAGTGIIKASMTTDVHQSIVVKNEDGLIIAKSTVYINPEMNYAVFNNIECNKDYRNIENKEKIYEVFIRGANAFVERYNLNNPDNLLEIITIGTSRNKIADVFFKNSDMHPVYEILETPDFTNWTLNGTLYAGNSKTEQVVLINKKREKTL
ncbi:MAG: leucine-rich repeat protein [bacterium]